MRLEVGIGRRPKWVEPAEYVLSSFEESEGPILDKILNQAVEALRVPLIEGVQMAMNRYQKKIVI